LAIYGHNIECAMHNAIAVMALIMWLYTYHKLNESYDKV
jgi:hypothetical protein